MATFTANGERAELFVPLSKFDERTGEFEAWATVDELDRHGEICDVEKSWPAIVADSEEQAKNSGGKSVGNLRRQHKRGEVIGKRTLVELRERDGVPAVYIAGKVTDEQAKSDAAEGVLTGVSIRGLATRWPDEQIKGAKRYAWTLVEEMSLVDKPAVPHALIEVMKSTGEVEMVKAVGRPVSQYWDCLNPECRSKHSRKDEAQKCEVPEDDADKLHMHVDVSLSDEAKAAIASGAIPSNATAAALPTKIEATKSEAPAIDHNVLLDKCLGCASQIGYLISEVTRDRAAGSYHPDDPGHEAIADAAVQKLWDAMRVLVNDLREKWMKDEGVTDDPAVMDVGKMLDSITSRLRGAAATNEVIKSLRVPTGNGSSDTTSHKEGTMEDTKGQTAPAANAGEGTGDGELLKSLEAKVVDLTARLDKIAAGEDTAKALGSVNEALATITARLDEIAKPNAEVEELKKSFAELAEGFEALVGALPVSRKGTYRAADKQDETADEEKEKAEGKTGNPFIDLVERVL